jgi:protein-S-isoprenylcysteine O-methyltransferase Ste14
LRAQVKGGEWRDRALDLPRASGKLASGVATSKRQERVFVLLSRWRIEIGAFAAVGAILAASPTPWSMWTFMPLVATGVGIRLWARGHLDRAQRVCTSGPYAITRHPLYVGSFLIGLGFALMAREWRLAPLYVAGFAVLYVPKALREEAYLDERFAGDYGRYATHVGALPWTVRAAGTEPGVPARFQWARVRRHREWRTWVGVLAIGGCLWALAANHVTIVQAIAG